MKVIENKEKRKLYDLREKEIGALVKAAKIGCAEIYDSENDAWVPINNRMHLVSFSGIYRTSFAPDYVNWEHVAPRFTHMARDDNGDVHLYTDRPYLIDGAWKGMGKTPTNCLESLRTGNVPWNDSVISRD